MNCATHNEVAAVAYCRTCGKPLCANCTRDVRGVIYCENCLAARLEGVQPPQAVYQQVMNQGRVPPSPGSGPNPALAGILAGFFPFGVGAVYTGQYAKGLAHLVTFTLLVVGLNSVHGALEPLLGLGMAFFYVYQIIDSVRSAKAVQMGQPAPDPFGLGQTFGAGEKVNTSKVPTAAVVLIGLGILFLLQTMGVFEFGFDRVWPVFLIGLGCWLFAARLGLVGSTYQDRRGRCRTGSLVGPAVLVTVGALSLSESLNGPGWGRTWPVLLLVIGLTKLLESSIPAPPPPPIPGGAGPGGVSSSAAQPPSSEVKNG
jgi:hypothetical protein